MRWKVDYCRIGLDREKKRETDGEMDNSGTSCDVDAHVGRGQ